MGLGTILKGGVLCCHHTGGRWQQLPAVVALNNGSSSDVSDEEAGDLCTLSIKLLKQLTDTIKGELVYVACVQFSLCIVSYNPMAYCNSCASLLCVSGT